VNGWERGLKSGGPLFRDFGDSDRMSWADQKYTINRWGEQDVNKPRQNRQARANNAAFWVNPAVTFRARRRSLADQTCWLESG